METLLNADNVNGHAITSAYVNAFSIDKWRDGYAFFGTFVVEYEGRTLFRVKFDGAEVTDAHDTVVRMLDSINMRLIKSIHQCGFGKLEFTAEHLLTDYEVKYVMRGLNVLVGEMTLQYNENVK